MSYHDNITAEDPWLKPKIPPASSRQLDYLYSVAEREGMDAEDLASIHYGKDLADLTEDEASTLIECMK